MAKGRTRDTGPEVWLPDSRGGPSRAVWIGLAVVALAAAAFALRDPLFGAGGAPSLPPARSIAFDSTAFLAGWATADGTDVDAVTGAPRAIRRTTDGMRMMLIPAGTFPMGAAPGDIRADRDEEPRHEVTLSKAYYFDEHEVTVGMWRKFAAQPGAKASLLPLRASGNAYPVGNLSWHEVQPYLAWARATLPTEAQWERAARGGHDDFVYPWGVEDDVTKRNASGVEDGFDGIAPVKSFPANDYGLFDMSGNVWEWCADSRRVYELVAETDPSSPATALSMLRGGSRIDDPGLARVSYRFDVRLEEAYANVGFRCARSLP